MINRLLFLSVKPMRMKRKFFKIVILTYLLPILSIAQKQSLWHVSQKKKGLEWALINDTSTIRLMNVKKGVLDFSYSSPEKVMNSTQTIIVMDETRNELKRVTLQNNKASFTIKDLFLIKAKSELFIYSISVPKDINVAKRARVGTQFIGKIVNIGNDN